MKEPFLPYIQDKLETQALIITCGLPGTAKTGIAVNIAKKHTIPILSSDKLRKELLKNIDIFDEQVASNFKIRKKVYDEMFIRAKTLLTEKKSVILDATFVTQELRLQAAELAVQQQKTFMILQTLCSKKKSLARILKRTKEDYESNALTEKAYINNEKKFQNVDITEIKKTYPSLPIIHLKIDTETDTSDQWHIITIEKQ
jgi:predicted kinase